MPKQITVVATNRPVPFERDASRTIGQEPVTVEKTAYYTRRIADGELREQAPVKPAASAAPSPAPSAGGKVN